jgi:hypothetical protein
MEGKFSLAHGVRTIGGVLGRSLIIGGANVLFVTIGGAAAQAAGLPEASFGRPVAAGLSLAILFAGGVLFGLTLGPLAARLPLRIPARIAVLFVTLFVLNQAINVIEALFFMTVPAADWCFSLTASAVEDAGLAVLLALLFRPQVEPRGSPDILRETLRTRRRISWLVRFLLAGALYLPVYFFFGAIAFRFVAPYYQNPGSGLPLTVPGFDVILPLELGRGLLYALTLFPLIALLQAGGRRTRWGVALWIIFVQVILGSWQPMLTAAFWPVEMRLAHGLELTADCIVYSLLVVWLTAPGRIRPDSVRTESAPGADRPVPIRR